MAYERTEQHRQQARDRIMRVKPWAKSTGPVTEKGKKRSRMNAKKPASVAAYFSAATPAEARLVWRRMGRRSLAQK
jgi:hypothetical protein